MLQCIAGAATLAREPSSSAPTLPFSATILRVHFDTDDDKSPPCQVPPGQLIHAVCALRFQIQISEHVIIDKTRYPAGNLAQVRGACDGRVGGHG
jgi:hypothetical protein